MKLFLHKVLLKFPSIRLLLKLYVLRFYRNANLKYTNFPPEIWIENTNHCNAECTMCPRDTHIRDKGVMDFDLYCKLITEISLHKNIVDRVHMHNFGEPLLDKKIYKKVRLAKDLGIKLLYFVTNASLLSKNNSEKIIKSGLDEMKISFYGIDEDSYNHTMKNLDFNKTIENVRQFFKVRRRLKSTTPKVVLQLLPQKNNDLDFQNKWISIFNGIIDKGVGDSLYISNLKNFGEGREFISTSGKTAVNVCRHPWKEMVILYDGSVAPCCFDYNGRIKLGSVVDNSIYKIWNGEKYKKIRKDFKNLDYENYNICKACDVPIN